MDIEMAGQCGNSSIGAKMESQLGRKSIHPPEITTVAC
jgi:hypothetical protein